MRRAGDQVRRRVGRSLRGVRHLEMTTIRLSVDVKTSLETCCGRPRSWAAPVADPGQQVVEASACARTSHMRTIIGPPPVPAASPRDSDIVNGMAESAGRSRRRRDPGGDQVRAERRDHRAVVGAQLRPRYAQRDAARRRRSSASARSRELAATPPPITSVSTPWSRQASIALAVSTSQTASWKLAATSSTGTGSPARSRASTQRATAVFSPENEKSNRCAARSFGAVRPRGNAIAAGRRRGPPVDERTARERQAEQPGDLVERLAGRVVDGRAERRHAGGESSTSSSDECPPETSSAMAGSGSGPCSRVSTATCAARWLTP